MPCGCSGKTGATRVTASGAQEYVYVNQSGQEVVRGTEMQAKAAAVRDGQAGTVRPS